MTFPIIAAFLYIGGFGYVRQRQGFWAAVFWPFGLGRALAKIAEREISEELDGESSPRPGVSNG